jgi:hypothetical protein
VNAFGGIGDCPHPLQVTIPSGESARRRDTGAASKYLETKSYVPKTDKPEAEVTKEREISPLLKVMPEREFDVHVVKVEGSGGDEGTSQSSHVTEIIRRVEQRMKN